MDEATPMTLTSLTAVAVTAEEDFLKVTRMASSVTLTSTTSPNFLSVSRS